MYADVVLLVSLFVAISIQICNSENPVSVFVHDVATRIKTDACSEKMARSKNILIN